MRVVRHKPSRRGDLVGSAPLVIAILVGGIAAFILDPSWWVAGLIALAIYCVLLVVTRLITPSHGLRSHRRAGRMT